MLRCAVPFRPQVPDQVRGRCPQQGLPGLSARPNSTRSMRWGRRRLDGDGYGVAVVCCCATCFKRENSSVIEGKSRSMSSRPGASATQSLPGSGHVGPGGSGQHVAGHVGCIAWRLRQCASCATMRCWVGSHPGRRNTARVQRAVSMAPRSTAGRAGPRWLPQRRGLGRGVVLHRCRPRPVGLIHFVRRHRACAQPQAAAPPPQHTHPASSPYGFRTRTARSALCGRRRPHTHPQRLPEARSPRGACGGHSTVGTARRKRRRRGRCA